MKPPLKLSPIDREHLQEMYDSTGVSRDELPFTPAFDSLVQGFQDRTFKNADHEQVFGAILKYVRTSGAAAGELPPVVLNEDQSKQLRAVLSRHLTGGKILPYSDAFNVARAEFNKQAGLELSDHDFWHSILRLQGGKRRPPPKKKVSAPAAEESDDAGDDE